MSQFDVGFDHTMSISEDHTSNQFKCMKIGASDNSALLNDSKAGVIVGVLQDDPDNSKVFVGRVRGVGYSKIILGGTVTRGDQVVSDASALGITDDAANQFVVGIAEESGVVTDIIMIRLVLAPTLTA